MASNNLHLIISKALQRLSLGENDVLADKRDKWNAFLMQISQNFFNYEQEHYLLVKSVEICLGKLNELNEKLGYAAKQIGMSEIAISVLHNIGNVLNSAGISVSLALEVFQNKNIEEVAKVSEIINEHLSHKDDYLTDDSIGQKIPDYLLALSKELIRDKNETLKEITNIDTLLKHIKDIIPFQKEFSGMSAIKEKINLIDVIDLSIQISLAASSSSEIDPINIIKNYHCGCFIITNKSKLLQIFINLIKNAKDALMFNKNKITITTRKLKDKPFIEISIKDNGIGIPRENLNKIFSLGYTTKKYGHGFGLHSSAIAANELGGSLRAESDGEGKGANFVLELPVDDCSSFNETEVLNNYLVS